MEKYNLSKNENDQQITAEELNAVADLWIGETFGNKDHITTGSDERIENTLNSMGLSREVSVNPTDTVTITRSEFKKRLINHLEESWEDGNLVISRNDGQIAGMVRSYQLNPVKIKEFADVPMFEVGRALTFPEFRGSGVYKKVRKDLLQKITSAVSPVNILNATRAPQVMSLNRADNWQEIGFEKYLEIHGFPPAYIERKKAEISQSGWTGFVHSVR